MRLHRLEVEGFGPFRERQSVDFDAFADDGIFLIAGRTGAGKSSILDAVCFGLYGGVPRYEGGEKRLRSDHCEPDDLTEVVVEFSTPAGRYRVTRSPDYERPKKRGGGMTMQAASVRLDALVGDEWITLAAKEREAAYELDEILQLSREQFLQVILLAQNRFSEFLLANSKDRQTLLRRLFGTERFEDVQRRFDERRRGAENALGSRLATVNARVEEAERLVADAQLAGDGVLSEEAGAADAGQRPPAFTIDERLEDLRRAAARADYRAERRASERDDAERRSAAVDAALSATREERRAQQERDRARAAMAALDAAESDIAGARTELERARAAETLRSVIAAAGRARDALTVAVDQERRAREAWDAFGVEITQGADAGADAGSGGAAGVDAAVRTPEEAEAEALQAWSSALTKESGAWERAREREQKTAHLIARAEEAAELVAAASARVEESARERTALPAELAAATVERDDVRRLADRSPDLTVARDAAAARRAAAQDAARLAEEHRIAAAAVVSAGDALAQAQSALIELRRRRLDGFAGELATALVEHEPCPVCGSREHPQPAEHTDPVSAEDVEAAEAARDAALSRERAAAERAAELNAALAAAITRADGRDEVQAAAELEACAEELEKSLAAGQAADALETRIAGLRARIDRLEGERTAADAALAAAREQHALALRERTEAESLVAEARGSFDTVAERLSHAAAQTAAARTLAEALTEVVRRTAASIEVEEELVAALAASDFDNVSAAESALRSPAAQAALDERISAHAVQREKERGILFDLELLTLPEDPIDLAPAEEASAFAREAWTAAVDEAARAAGTAERLGALIESAASEHARTAAEAAEFEVIRDLADTIAGRGANTRKMTLETFVLAAELEEIVDAANRRLHDMSAGRYQLRHSDALAARGAASGLGIVVFDAFTGQTRPAQSLSGGETFLSSLALALGLAEVVTARAGGIRLDTLFIDEGFGSLDGDTLDVAMRTLDELRQGGRTVGVISHVEAMQEQIPAQLTVRATSEGPSVIEAR